MKRIFTIVLALCLAVSIVPKTKNINNDPDYPYEGTINTDDDYPYESRVCQA